MQKIFQPCRLSLSCWIQASKQLRLCLPQTPKNKEIILGAFPGTTHGCLGKGMDGPSIHRGLRGPSLSHTWAFPGVRHLESKKKTFYLSGVTHIADGCLPASRRSTQLCSHPHNLPFFLGPDFGTQRGLSGKKNRAGGEGGEDGPAPSGVRLAGS